MSKSPSPDLFVCPYGSENLKRPLWRGAFSLLLPSSTYVTYEALCEIARRFSRALPSQSSNEKGPRLVLQPSIVVRDSAFR
jgi:hypothetical protein